MEKLACLIYFLNYRCICAYFKAFCAGSVAICACSIAIGAACFWKRMTTERKRAENYWKSRIKTFDKSTYNSSNYLHVNVLRREKRNLCCNIVSK